MLSLSRQLLPRMAGEVARHQVARQALLSTTSSLKSSDPNLQAADYPKTKEERERAAKKYNLIIEDYEPYPEEEGWGDYPNLKCIGAYNKDWYEDYDDLLEHRYYGEPIEFDADLYYWERIDPFSDERPAQLPNWQQHLIFFSICTLPFALYWFFTSTPTGKKIHINHQLKFKTNEVPGTQFYWFPTREEPQHH